MKGGSASTRYILRGIAIAWVSVLVVIPVAALVVAAVLKQGPSSLALMFTDPVARHALVLTFVTSAVAATINALAGTMIAWALVRRAFPGKPILSAMVDIPFAVPTLVTGVVLVALLGPQAWLGQTFIRAGFPIVFARPGIVLALLFISLPLVVRTLEPVVAGLDPNEEDAAATLGASKWIIFRHILLPAILPALAAAWVQAFARCIAEFGSIAALSGNVPRETLVASVYILGEIEAGNPTTAAAMSVVLLVIALALQPISRALTAKGGAHV